MAEPVGPGRHYSRGPVDEAYADCIDHLCPPPPKGCGANAGDYCTQPGTNGPIPKHIPCLARNRTEGENP